MNKFFYILVFCLIINLGFSQNNYNIPNYKDSLFAGVEMYNNGKYHEALKVYGSIPENDTNYITAVSEQLLIYYVLEEYSKGVEIAENAIKNWRHSLSVSFFSNYGVCLDMIGKNSQAVEVYNIALSKFPMNYLLHYNKGISLEMMKHHKEAFEEYKKAVEINPFYSKVHYKLGAYALNEGKISLGILAYNTFLLLDPNSELSNAVLVELNEICSTKLDEKLESKGVDVCEGEDYSEIDLLVTNYVALNKKYKVNSKFKYPAVKQSHLIFQKFSELSESNQFWYRTYVPFFKHIMKEGMFEDYSYYISQSSNSNSHKKIIEKNVVKINSFMKNAFSIFDEINRNFYLDKKYNNVFRGNEGFAVSSLCNLTDDKKNLKGDFADFYPAGNLKSIGKYSDNGLKTGEWKLYNEESKLIERDTYEDNVLIDTLYTYSDFGIISGKYSVKDDKLDGAIKYYNPAGALMKQLYVFDNKIQGKVKEFYTNGSLLAEYNVVDNETDGRYISYYPGGEIFEILNYKIGKKTGVDTVFHNNGNIYFTGKVIDDKYEGALNYYWNNGKIQSEYNYNDGIMSGIQKEYLRDGTLASQSDYDEKGKLNGIKKEFYSDGKVFSEIDYQKSEIIAYRFYDKKGKTIEDQIRKKGRFYYVGYRKNGNIMSKGEYGKKLNQGKWDYYDKYGILESSVNYTDGKVNGEASYYYPNGYRYQKESIKDDKSNGHIFGYSPYKIMLFEGYYKDEIKTGTHKTYYNDGTLLSEAYYIDDKLNGYFKDFCPEGKLYRKSYYEDGVLKSIKTYSSSGSVIDSTALDNDTRHIVLHNESGDVIFDYHLKHNKIEGKYYEYYPGKIIKTKASYLNGKLNGIYEEYHNNGNLKNCYNYSEGNRNGENKDYYYDGNIKFEGNYNMDELDGKYTWYFSNGKKEIEGLKNNGLKIGRHIYYSPDGAVNHYRYFDEDAVKAYGYIENGVEKTVEFNGTGKIKLYFENGNISREFQIENGWYEGDFKEYYSSGKIYEHINFKYDKPEGEHITYFENGNVKIKSIFANGVKFGEELEYFPNGKIHFIRNYINGYLQGSYEEYNEAGDLMHKYLYRYNDIIKTIK